MLTAKQPAIVQDPVGQTMQPSLAGSRADILAQVGTRAGRELVVFDRLHKALIVWLAPSVGRENAVSSMAAALLRWDDDGGHPAAGARVVKPTHMVV